MNWITVHQLHPTKKGKSEAISVRASSVDSLMPRTTYTTLLVHGRYVHVTETVDEVRTLIGTS